MELPPDTLTAAKGSKMISPEKIKIDKKIELALNAFYRVIDQNHGLKEANLLALLLPIGIDSDDLDSVMLVTMDAFGKQRGLIAHKSATSYRATQTPDPANELNKIQQITPNNELAKKTGCSLSTLNQIVRKGEGAYFSSGSRPNQTAQSWGLARLASAITAGKAAAVDYSILDKGCDHKKKAFLLAKKSRKRYKYGHSKTRKVTA